MQRPRLDEAEAEHGGRSGQCDRIARAQRRAGDEMNVAVGEGAAKTRRAPVGREMDGDAALGQRRGKRLGRK